MKIRINHPDKPVEFIDLKGGKNMFSLVTQLGLSPERHTAYYDKWHNRPKLRVAESQGPI